MSEFNSYFNALPINDNDKLVLSKIKALRQMRTSLKEFIATNKQLLLECGIHLDNNVDKINNRINFLKHNQIQ